MNLTIIFIAIVVVAIVVVATIIVIYKKSGFSRDGKLQEAKDMLIRTQALLESKQQELDRVYEENRELQRKKEELSRELGNSEANVKDKEEELKERMQNMEVWYNDMQVKFGEIAKKLMDEKESGFEKRNSEVLEPLRDSLKVAIGTSVGDFRHTGRRDGLHHAGLCTELKICSRPSRLPSTPAG